jgi:ornithine cyclodeaminase
MDDGSMMVIKGVEVQQLLNGRETEVIEVVRLAYEAHAAGDTSLPHSTFLHFPDNQRNRIIALPAYLGGGFGIAGIKWVSSFPDNLDRGLDRASAIIILNSTETGRPVAFCEGSIISAKRTAASAALAAQRLRDGNETGAFGLVGCSLINYETARFVLAACPDIKKFILYDLDEARARIFKEKCGKEFKDVEVEIAGDVRDLLRRAKLISIATTAIKPHLFDLSDCAPGTTILHISLRDLSPEVILEADNVVDDVDHVCRAQTSIHLAAQLVGHRDFVRCTLGDVLTGTAPARNGDGRIVVFSPFGLGILDLALTDKVRKLALKTRGGEDAQEESCQVISDFLPDSWGEKK